jgi:hypothetical protein
MIIIVTAVFIVCVLLFVSLICEEKQRQQNTKR